MNTVVQFGEPLSRIAERIRSAIKRCQRGRWEWIEGTLELASALAEGRDRYSSDREFSHWLVDEELDDIGHQDRAALISMAENLPLARLILEESQRVSWQHIWKEEMQGRFTQVSNHPETIEISQSAELIALKEASSENAAAKSEVRVDVIKRNHPFFGLTRADEVAAIYRHSKTRAAIGLLARKHRAIWPMILEMIDAGLLIPTDGIREQPNLGILFPDAPLAFRQKFNLSKSKELQAVKDRIIPAALANRRAIIKEPSKIAEIIEESNRKLREQLEAERRAKRLEAAKAAMKANEREVMIFGRLFWPLVDLPHPETAYTFEELRHAVWTFRELHTAFRLSADGSPHSCAVRIRHVTKFLNGFMNKKVMCLINDMSRALQENPEGAENLPDMPNLDRAYD